MKLRAFPLLLLVLLAHATLGQSNADRARFAGEYFSGHEFGGGKIVLKADGTFEEHVGSDDMTSVTRVGTFQPSNGKLLISSVKTSSRRGETEFTVDPNENRDFSMFSVEWSGRIYLLDESYIDRFVDAINLRIEPRKTLLSWHTNGTPWMGAFYLRKGDEKKKVVGPPPLPDPWRERLLTRSVIARVIKIDSVDKREFSTGFTATINKGRRAGLKVGHKLVFPRQKDTYPDMAEVISVSERTSKVKISLVRKQLKLGNQLTSTYKPPWYTRFMVTPTPQ